MVLVITLLFSSAGIFRTKAPSTYGFRTLLYGTLLPAPLIVQTEPGVFIRAVEEGHDCSEVLIQLAAVRSALDNTGKVILKDHMRHCMVDAVAAGDEDAIDDLCQAIDKFMK